MSYNDAARRQAIKERSNRKEKAFRDLRWKTATHGEHPSLFFFELAEFGVRYGLSYKELISCGMEKLPVDVREEVQEGLQEMTVLRHTTDREEVEGEVYYPVRGYVTGNRFLHKPGPFVRGPPKWARAAGADAIYDEALRDDPDGVLVEQGATLGAVRPALNGEMNSSFSLDNNFPNFSGVEDDEKKFPTMEIQDRALYPPVDEQRYRAFVIEVAKATGALNQLEHLGDTIAATNRGNLSLLQVAQKIKNWLRLQSLADLCDSMVAETEWANQTMVENSGNVTLEDRAVSTIKRRMNITERKDYEQVNLNFRLANSPQLQLRGLKDIYRWIKAARSARIIAGAGSSNLGLTEEASGSRHHTEIKVSHIHASRANNMRFGATGDSTEVHNTGGGGGDRRQGVEDTRRREEKDQQKWAEVQRTNEEGRRREHGKRKRDDDERQKEVDRQHEERQRDIRQQSIATMAAVERKNTQVSICSLQRQLNVTHDQIMQQSNQWKSQQATTQKQLQANQRETNTLAAMTQKQQWPQTNSGRSQSKGPGQRGQSHQRNQGQYGQTTHQGRKSGSQRSNAQCKRGANCHFRERGQCFFRHDEPQEKSGNSRSGRASPQTQNKGQHTTKSNDCFDWLRGKCRIPEATCRFDHKGEPAVCITVYEGRACYRQSECPYRHPEGVSTAGGRGSSDTSSNSVGKAPPQRL
jgi:hypothetical protein